MITATIVSAAGEVLLIVSAGTAADITANTPEGCVAVTGAPPAGEHYRAAGEWVAKPAKPRQTAQWEASTKGWIDARTLAEARVERWSAMTAVRTARLTSTFTAGGKTYDCNREAIALAAIGAMLAKAALDLTWTKTWTLADNTSTTLTADQVLIVARACEDYITALWATGRTLHAQIDAATTIAAVDAITWP